MAILIDGYNLLFAWGTRGREGDPRFLERSRVALLDFLGAALPPSLREQTTVVFDAREAPRDLPRNCSHQGLSVRFCERGEEADDMLERLIQADSTPRRLTVVSSDHRVQTAASRRKATAVDVDAWLDQVERLRRSTTTPGDSDAPEKPSEPSSADEVAYWRRLFDAQ